MSTKYIVQKYKNTYSDSTVTIVNLENQKIFCEDEANFDYQQYLAWIAEGNTPEECEYQ